MKDYTLSKEKIAELEKLHRSLRAGCPLCLYEIGCHLSAEGPEVLLL